MSSIEELLKRQAELNRKLTEAQEQLDAGENSLYVALGCFEQTLDVVCLLAVRSFVISCLWWWFVCPFGMPRLSVTHAAGMFLVYLAFARLWSGADKPEQRWAPYSNAGITLLMGWGLWNLMQVWSF